MHTGRKKMYTGRVKKYSEIQKSISITPAFKRWFKNSKVCDSRGRPLVVYHGTTSFFTIFENTSDIGFHFGTREAAKDRLSKIHTFDVEIKHIQPSRVEEDSLRALKGEIGWSLPEYVYCILLHKLDHPVSNLLQKIEAESEKEQIRLKEEYLEKPDSPFFQTRIETAQRKGFAVFVQGEEVSLHKTKREAEARANRIRQTLAKPQGFFLCLQNPLRLSDLGVWPPFGIAQEAKFSPVEINKVMEKENNFERYRAIREILTQKGYDGIVYRNEVENVGTDSYIAFESTQIKSVENNGDFDPDNPDTTM